MKAKTIAFDDGIARFYEPGTEECKHFAPFHEEVVGYKRYNEHYASGHKVSRLISIRTSPIKINAYDTVVIKGEQYKILLIQPIPDTLPPKTMITLEQSK